MEPRHGDIDDPRQLVRRSDDRQIEQFRAPWQAVAWLLGVVVAIVITYNVTMQRVAVLESRVDGLKSDVSEIRNDVKTLLRRTQ